MLAWSLTFLFIVVWAAALWVEGENSGGSGGAKLPTSWELLLAPLSYAWGLTTILAGLCVYGKRGKFQAFDGLIFLAWMNTLLALYLHVSPDMAFVRGCIVFLSLVQLILLLMLRTRSAHVGWVGSLILTCTGTGLIAVEPKVGDRFLRLTPDAFDTYCLAVYLYAFAAIIATILAGRLPKQTGPEGNEKASRVVSSNSKPESS